MTLFTKKIHLLGLLLVLHSSYALSMDTDDENKSQEKENSSNSSVLRSNIINNEEEIDIYKLSAKIKKNSESISRTSGANLAAHTQMNNNITSLQSEVRLIKNRLGFEEGSVTEIQYNSAPGILNNQDAIYEKKPFNKDTKTLEYRSSNKYKGFAPKNLYFPDINGLKWTQTLNCHNIIDDIKKQEARKSVDEFFLQACNYTYKTIGIITIGCLNFAYKNSLLHTNSIPKDTKSLVATGIVGTTFVSSFLASQFYFPKKLAIANNQIKDLKENLQNEYKKSPEL